MEPESAGRAREFVRSMLRHRRHEAIEDSAMLCVSELVANVSRHTGSHRCIVTVKDDDDVVTIEVSDDARDSPEVESVTEVGSVSGQEERGRGLRIVDALAGEWGVRHDGDGKAVWVRIPVH